MSESRHTCHHCGGDLEAQRVDRLLRVEGQWVVVENVEALVCTQCGEIYFTPAVHDQIIDLISGGQAPTRIDHVPVFDASAG